MISFLIKLYMFIIVLDVILSYLPQLARYQVVQNLHSLANICLKPIRKFLRKNFPQAMGHLDLSPLILLVILQLVLALW